jgi:hypothetical protein
MSGDLSISPQPARQDLAASLATAQAPAPRPGLRDDAGSLAVAAEPEPGVLAEAVRLKRLLTDPAMQVNTFQDEAADRTVLRVQSRTTGEIIEQIPSEALLRLYATMRESLVDERA